jgi:nucleoside-diphosphate-sugar epimerase
MLITGGRGGIGRSITEVVAARADVRVVTLGRSKPMQADDQENVHHEVGDVADSAFVSDLLGRHAITHIVHAAGVRTRDCEKDPRLAFEGNVLSTERLLQAATRHVGLVKFLHLSTAAVYGRTEEPVDEAAALSAGWAYATSKAASELVLAPDPLKPRSFATVILRPGFVLSPWSQGLLAALVDEAMRSDHVTGILPDRFPLHWAPDLARTVDRLLEADTGTHCVLHPPACNTGTDEFARCLKEAAKRRGRSPSINIQPDRDAPFPAGLVDDAFRKLVGSFELTPLLDMLEKRLSAFGVH